MKSKDEIVKWCTLVLLYMLIVFVTENSGNSQDVGSINFRIPVATINNGGARTSSSNLKIQYSIAQPTPVENVLSEGVNFKLYCGFQPATFGPFPPCEIPKGDVNGDCLIDVLDVLAIVNDILGIAPLSGEAADRADCNGDGLINVLDALNIINIILGIIPECLAGQNARTIVTDETIEFLKVLAIHFPAVEFNRLMAMVEKVQIPAQYNLAQNYPNPFNPETSIDYALPVDGSVRLDVYNTLGQKVATLVDEYRSAGMHTITWNGAEMPSGVYFYRITAGELTAANKMILMK